MKDARRQAENPRGQFWRCEGCGEVNEMREIDKLRSVEITIRTSAAKTQLMSVSAELCPTCQRRLLQLANPREWD